jgi:hypothetical protein
MGPRARAAFWFIAASCLTVSAVITQAPPQPALVIPARLTQLLTKHFQFSVSDVAGVARGVVVKSLPTGESREVAVAGAFWCDVPLEYFLTRARDIVSFKKVKEVQQIGLFETPARSTDLDSLKVDQQDIDVLRKCKPGDCEFKLDAAGLERMRREVVWSAPGAPEHAQRLVRELVASYVASYQLSGNAGLIEYADDKPPVKVAKGLEALLNRSLWLHEASPGLRQYLDAFPLDPMPHADSVVYWSKEAFGMKPTISATHTTIWRGTGGLGDAAIFAKQIYASHYLEASISVTVLMRDDRAEPGGVFVVYQNRSLVDLLQGGFLGPLRRSIAKSRTKDGLSDQLQGLKRRLETEFRSTGG